MEGERDEAWREEKRMDGGIDVRSNEGTVDGWINGGGLEG